MRVILPIVYRVLLSSIAFASISSCTTPPATSVYAPETITPIPLPSATNPPTTTPTLTPTAIPSVTPTLTATIIQTPSPTATLFGGGDGIFSEMSQQVGNRWETIGIYRFDISTKNIRKIAGPEYELVGISPDYKDLLAQTYDASLNFYELFVIHISDGSATKIAENVFGSWDPAYWYENNLIAYIGWELGSKYVYTVRPDGSGLTKISKEGMRPLMINPSPAQTGVCWTSGSYHGVYFNLQESWCAPFDGSDPIDMKFAGNIVYSSLEGYLAYTRSNESDIAIISPGGTTFFRGAESSNVSFISPEQWSPDGKKLLAVTSTCVERCTVQYLVLSANGVLMDIAKYDQEGFGPIAWSPDSTQLLFDNYVYNIITREVTLLSEFFPEGWTELGHALWGDRTR